MDNVDGYLVENVRGSDNAQMLLLLLMMNVILMDLHALLMEKHVLLDQFVLIITHK